ncbi:MAG TPA: response regulator [Thermoanaerobaculia bacterium]|nr:response regulator [Thermoanaerobaculia bacterium]
MPTVLVVDDDEPIRVLITALCRRLGLAVEWAADGDTGLTMIRRRRYDAILLDLMLPMQNGFEVLRELRAHEPEMLARTIIITAVSDVTLRDFDGGGTLALLRKPFDIHDLCDALAACTGCDTPQLSVRKPSANVVQA